MENISAKTPRRRGRPPTIPEWERRLSAEHAPHLSARHRNNTIYLTRVILWAADDPRFEWLCSAGATLMAGRGQVRHTILAALGRIEEAQDREAMALYLCEHKPPTREALALIQAFRRGTRPPSSAAHLADVLRRALNTYLAAHHPLPWDAVREALYEVVRDVDQAAAEG